jgi:bacterial/archaeal transporter family-2 protein
LYGIRETVKMAQHANEASVAGERVVRLMTVLLILTAVGMGVLFSVQAGVNAQLRIRTGDAIQAAAISTSVSTITLLVITLIRHQPIAPLGQLTDGPWWIWIGGVMGAVIVALTLVMVVRLGASVLIASILVGQMLAALTIDHFGYFGVSQHAVSAPRIAGALLLVVGLVLIRAF